MQTKRKRSWSGNRRFRLMLTLELAVMLPAAALIYVNFYHLKSIKRDKTIEATIHRDFQYMLGVSQKKISDRIYTMTDEVRDDFPSPDTDNESEKERKLELILSNHPWVAHVFLFDAKQPFVFRSQPAQMCDPGFRAEHDRSIEMYQGWLGMEGMMLCETTRNKSRGIACYTDFGMRTRYTLMASALFTLPQLSKDRIVLGGISFDPTYLSQTFFPGIFEELIAEKLNEDPGYQLAMVVYPSDSDGDNRDRLIAASTGWG